MRMRFPDWSLNRGVLFYTSIAETFGTDVLLPDGSLNREKLGSLIFNDREKREKLNGIMHPAVRKEMLRQKEEWLEKGANTVIMDIPLLFESKLQSYVDKIIVVSATPQIQRERLMARNGYSADEAEARINSQLSIAEKEKGADAVIDNNGTLEETEKQLDELLVEWNANYNLFSEKWNIVNSFTNISLAENICYTN